MFPELRNAIKRSMLHYYVALQMSAGAIAPLHLSAVEDGPPPIVRRYQTHNASPWDPREIVRVNGQSAIVLLPDSSENDNPESIIRLN